jgi:hypothetical protein
MWQQCHEIVHGRKIAETVATTIITLHTKVNQHYQLFQENESYVFPRHGYLFTECSLEIRLSMSYDCI